MRSFSEFADHRDCQALINECAKIISEMDGEPEQILAKATSSLDEVNWLGAAGNVAGAVARGVGTAVAGAAKGVAQGTGAAASGIGATAQDVSRQMKIDADARKGALAKFDNTVKMLQQLEQELRKNPATAQMRSQNLQGRSVAGYIQAIWKALQKERSSMPILQQDGQTYAQQRKQPGTQQQQQQSNAANPGGMKFVPAATA